jgi:hypothetical protein
MHSGIAKGLAVVGATGALIGGGAALANAASGGSGSSSTTPKSGTTPPAASTQPKSGHHCPHMNGSGGNNGSGFQGPAPSTTQT